MSRKLLLDILERTLWTYVQAFLGMLLASSVLDVSTLKLAAVAALPAALAVVKGFAASRIGDPETAAIPPVNA